MYWAAGVNKNSVAELTLCYMVLTIRRVHEFSSKLRAGEWRGPWASGVTCEARLWACTDAAISARKSSSCCSPMG